MPPRLFSHRTSAAGFAIIFLGAVVLQAVNHFLPIYFQAVRGASPLTSGVDFLPFALAILPAGGAAGAFLSKTGRYIPLHLAGFALSAIGLGLFALLDSQSSRAAWVCFQLIAAAGTAAVFTATLPSTLAPLPEADVAVATGTYSFVRSFGLVWGVTVASVVFNGRVDASLHAVEDAAVRAMLADGGAYAYASSSSMETLGAGGGIASLPGETKVQVVRVYVQALRVVWLVMVGIAGLGILVTLAEKHVELRKDNSTDFGLVEKKVQESENADADADADAEVAQETGL